MHEHFHPRRRGFTLIELLVVIAIIALLSAMAYFVGGALTGGDKAQRGGATVAQTLQIAKQKALNDRIIYGVRLVRDPGTGYYTGLEYISQPPDYVSGSQSPANTYQVQAGGGIIQFSQDISGGLDPTGMGVNKNLWPIQQWDYLQTEDGPSPRLITRIGPDSSRAPQLFVNQVEVQTPITTPPTNASSNFRVMRSPRSVAGEEIVKLPQDVIVDVGLSLAGNGPLTPDPFTGQYDLQFAPAQGMVGAGGRVGKIVLWVRNVNDNPATSKNQVLIVIRTGTGVITSYPVDTGSGNFYSYTNDPRPMGL